MGYVNNKKEPALVYVGDDRNELNKIADMVNKLNADLIDSGFEQYKFDLEIVGEKAYIKRV